MAFCYLHNYLRKRNVQAYLDPGFGVDDVSRTQGNEGNFRSDKQPIPLAPTCSRNATSSAKTVRDAFCNYFNNEGSVSWQESRIDM